MKALRTLAILRVLAPRSFNQQATSAILRARPSKQNQQYPSALAGPSAWKRHASSDSSVTTSDPSEHQAMEALEDGTRCLEEGDIEGARSHYARSLEIQKTPGAFFNLGVTEYHLKNTAAAIEAWQEAIKLSPSADAHTNLASAYILSKPPQPALAIRHLKSAMELAPDDPEIAFNLAAILESTGNLAPSLKLYQKAVSLGIDRAQQNVLNVASKLAALKAGAKGETHVSS